MSARPRLLCPGLVELIPDSWGRTHEVVLGDLAGYLLGEDITNWKNTYTFVALDDLSLEERVRFAPHLAAEWKAIATEERGTRGYRGEGAKRPHLVRLLMRARLLLVEASDRRDLGPARDVPLDGPRRVVEVGFARNADDWFWMELRRGKKTLASVSGPYHELFATDRDRDRTLDRTLAAATFGLADSRQISLAFWIADVADADGWEAHLAAIAARAAPHETLAGEVARALRDAPEGADRVELPAYGMAQRIRLGGFVVKSPPDKKKRTPVKVPPASVWVVAGVDPDPVPAPPPSIFRRPAATPKHDARRGCFALGLVLLLIAGLVALAMRGQAVGEPCREWRECRSRMCLQPRPGEAGYCTRGCKTDAECKEGWSCQPVPYGDRKVCQR